MKWLFHLARREEIVWGADGRYAPASLAREGFIHASYKDAVAESARLYFEDGAQLRVLAIDPRRLDKPVEIAVTPRGDMPHIRGPIPADAIKLIGLDDVPSHPDVVTGTRIGFVAYEGMTLLDLVGPLDALSRIGSMGFDTLTTCEVVSVGPGDRVWAACGLAITASSVRPALDKFDVLVIPGGPGTRSLVDDEDVVRWIDSFPHNRLVASVCTGALLLGAAGRLRGVRATTHHRLFDGLAEFGAHVVERRIVDELQIVTAAGVTSGIDLGLHLVRRLTDDVTATAIARQMETSLRA